jgi:hypothetical protein
MMLNMISSRRFLLFLIGCCLLLPSCASTEHSKAVMKVGMHIDAVLEFAVEYPLSWEKERLISYGSREGEVRWTPPGRPETLLRIKSTLQKRSAVNIGQEIDEILQNYNGLQITRKEQVSLPGGAAWHVSGQSAHEVLELYLIPSKERFYLITLTSPKDARNSDQEVMQRVTESFQVIP